MATVHNIHYPSTHFSTNILGNYNKFWQGGEGVGPRGSNHPRTVRLTLPTIADDREDMSRDSSSSNLFDSHGLQHKPSPHHGNSLSSENLNAGFPLHGDYPDPPKTGDTFGKRSENCRPFLPSRDTTTTKGSTGHMLYKHCRQLFASRSKLVDNEDRYIDATKNSRKLTNFPGVDASPAPIYHDRRKETSKRKPGNAVNRLDIRWYPHTSETVTHNWDRTFTYSDNDVTFRERLTGSPSRVVSTVIQLPTIYNEKTDSRDKYIVKWLHSVPDNNPYSHSRCDSVSRMNSTTPMSLKTVDSYYLDQTVTGKPTVYSSF